jgi:Tol biopolymer transport system component/DNA-binding winged helix-turn-helix (wHTH) protein
MRTGELRNSGLPIRLPGQSFQILATLLSCPGELVTREELQRRLWPDHSFGDLDHGLKAAVNRVREALGDSAEAPRFIETLPRRGYRFIGTIERGANAPRSAQLIIGSPPETALLPVDLHSTRRRTPFLLGIAAVLLLSLAATLWLHFRAHRAAADPAIDTHEALTITPLTTLPGSEWSPAFSPDGGQVAFGWDSGHSDQPEAFDLYAKIIGIDNVQRLTHHPAKWITPAWSPDGRTIAFIRQSESNGGVFLVSARGGPERKLADGPHPQFAIPDGLSWSPDGRELIYSYGWAMQVIAPETGAIRRFDTPSPCRNPYGPSVSPDGSAVVFGCFMDEAKSDFYLLPRLGGKARLLMRSSWVGGNLTWSSDSKQVIFQGSGGLFRISKDGGPIHRLPFGDDAADPTISPPTGRLAYVKNSFNVNLWRVDLRNGLPVARTVLAPTSSVQQQPSISPNGKRIVFESDRTGSHEVWVSNLDGSDAVQLTHLHALTGSASWSPDGRQIVFDSRATGRPALYLLNPTTATPKAIPIADLDPWCRLGRVMVAGSTSTPGTAFPGIYKVRPEGGAPIRISKTDGWHALESSVPEDLRYPGSLPRSARSAATSAAAIPQRTSAGPSTSITPRPHALHRAHRSLELVLHRPDAARLRLITPKQSCILSSRPTMMSSA